jgi:CubicO group peptidase (beta-lactamase class C family)
MNTFNDVFRYVQNLVTSGKLPSAVFGIADKNGVIDLQAFNAKEDSIYLLFSVTKPMIGMAMAQLWERGLIGLNEPVTHYIPDFGRSRTDTVTMWHLLTHTSGIDQTFAELLMAPPDDNSMPVTSHQVLVSAPMQFPVGRFKLYNNVAFTGLKEIIEQASGCSLDEYLAHNLFDPLGMNDTSFNKLEEAPDRVMPMHGTEIFNYQRYLKSKSPAGGIYGTAPDLLKLGQALLNGGAWNGQRMLGSLTLKAMTTPQTTGIPPLRAEDFVGEEVGLTFFLPVNRTFFIVRSQYGHNGWGGCMFWVYPEQGVCFALTTNLMDPWGKGIDLDRIHNVFAACL